jgi:hypothetical protein
MQADDSTDTVFVLFCFACISEKHLQQSSWRGNAYDKPLPTHTTGEDIFNLIYLSMAEKGNNMVIFTQMAHSWWLEKCMVLFHC